MLERARRGISIFESPKFKEQFQRRSLPFLKDSFHEKSLSHYLSLSVANQTFSPELPTPRKVKIARLIERVDSDRSKRSSSADDQTSNIPLSKVK